MKGIHQNLKTDEIYSNLRQAHGLIKDIIYMDGYEDLSNEKKNAMDAIHSVLYLVESKFIDF